MNEYLALKLQGPMQAWGTHTYEDFRPSSIFPTRSGIIGLIGSCIGIRRNDIEGRENLNKAIFICVVSENPESMRKIEDFHTVKEARKVDGKPRKEAIVSKREYLCDSFFTVLISIKDDSIFSLDNIEEKLNNPVFTPFLGRKSCPLTRPLTETRINAETLLEAIDSVCKTSSRVIYSEIPLDNATKYVSRDIPVKTEIRQFDKRPVYVLAQEAANVSD